MRARGLCRKFLGLTLTLLVVAGSGGQTLAASVEDLLWDMQVIPLDGQVASDFTLEGLDGEQVSLRDFRGKVVLLYFWKTT